MRWAVLRVIFLLALAIGAPAAAQGCEDCKIIKKGVSDRAQELSEGGTARPRPPYLHVLPLAQIIQTLEGASSPNTKKCRAIYASCIEACENEIALLIDVPIDDIRAIHKKVADAIAALRNGTVILHPGGGGKYGTFSFCAGS